MSLESQLIKKADNVFHERYIKMFQAVEIEFRGITGVNEGMKGAEAIKEFTRHQYFSQSDTGTLHVLMRDAHREIFIAAFIKKAEEVAAFIEQGES